MLRRQRGFSLIELIMVIVIISIISVMMSQILQKSFQNYLTSQNNSEIDWQGFLSLENFANDVQSIRSSNDIATTGTSQFSFTNHLGSTVTYQVTSGTLMRNSVALATGVNSMVFTYYDKNYVVTPTPANVRYVAIAITLRQNNLQLPFTTLASTRGLA
jgi:prepilin-type N-terminal cleavage/methylation domain-containing protein